MEDVNPPALPLTEAKAEATRRVVVEAAGRLFRERGYRATTMGAIAAEAGVAVQTIYNSVGSKAALLSRLLDVTIVGDHDEPSLIARIRERTRDVSDPKSIVADLAATAAAIHERTGWIFELISTAVDDPEIAALQRNNEASRMAGYVLAARELRRRLGLEAGLTDERTAARIWTIANPQTYRFLVRDRGWSVEDYRRWLEGTLAAALLRRDPR